MVQKVLQIIVSGKVQGVSYRFTTQQQAIALNLAGWVRNLDTGQVEIHAVGEDAQLDKLINWCHQGPTHAEVTEVKVTELTADAPKLNTFKIR